MEPLYRFVLKALYPSQFKSVYRLKSERLYLFGWDTHAVGFFLVAVEAKRGLSVRQGMRALTGVTSPWRASWSTAGPGALLGLSFTNGSGYRCCCHQQPGPRMSEPRRRPSGRMTRPSRGSWQAGQTRMCFAPACGACSRVSTMRICSARGRLRAPQATARVSRWRTLGAVGSAHS